MATLSVLTFADSLHAEAAVPTLANARRVEELSIDDGALVAWQPGRRRPASRQLSELPLIRPLSPNFWHLFFGSTLLLPIAMEALGGPAPRGGSLEGLGIEDRFVRQLRRSLVADTSAILLLTRDATPDRVVSALGELDFTLLSASLSDRQRGALHAAFEAEGDDRRTEEFYLEVAAEKTEGEE